MESKLAVLIDADNVPYSNIKGMLDELKTYGDTVIKRIYGDWTTPNLSGWKSVLLEYAIVPIQQYRYTVGKNATDSAMIIDAMDILHRENIDGFCIVSSDSDFTRLATRLRESGKIVIGMGEQKTPKPFVSACNRFIYIELLQNTIAAKDVPRSKSIKQNTYVSDMSKEDLIELLNRSITDLADDDGWAFLGDLGNLLLKKKPDFDPRSFGYPKLTPLIESMGEDFIVEKRDVGNSSCQHIYVKIK